MTHPALAAEICDSVACPWHEQLFILHDDRLGTEGQKDCSRNYGFQSSKYVSLDFITPKAPFPF